MEKHQASMCRRWQKYSTANVYFKVEFLLNHTVSHSRVTVMIYMENLVFLFAAKSYLLIKSLCCKMSRIYTVTIVRTLRFPEIPLLPFVRTCLSNSNYGNAKPQIWGCWCVTEPEWLQLLDLSPGNNKGTLCSSVWHQRPTWMGKEGKRRGGSYFVDRRVGESKKKAP